MDYIYCGKSLFFERSMSQMIKPQFDIATFGQVY